MELIEMIDISFHNCKFSHPEGIYLLLLHLWHAFTVKGLRTSWQAKAEQWATVATARYLQNLEVDVGQIMVMYLWWSI